jgi:1,4-alpha-glucan branching enzyme
MTTFHVLTTLQPARLHLWRDRAETGASSLAYDAEPHGVDDDALLLFPAQLDHQLHEPAHAALHDGRWGHREPAELSRTLPRVAEYRFPEHLWLVEGAVRVLQARPFDEASEQLRVHVVTSSVGESLLVWLPGREPRKISEAGRDELGPYFDLPLSGPERHWLCFRLAPADGSHEGHGPTRLWVAADGAEVWVHAQSAAICCGRPLRRTLHVRMFDYGAPGSPRLRLFEQAARFEQDVEGVLDAGGWRHYAVELFTELVYWFRFWTPGPTEDWEHVEAQRNVVLAADGSVGSVFGDGQLRPISGHCVWTLEGDHQLFGQEPVASLSLVLHVAAAAPDAGIERATIADVWINRARRPLRAPLGPEPDGTFVVRTFPDVVTSVRFRDGDLPERVERHPVRLPRSSAEKTERFVVLGRADALSRPPVSPLFVDPPYVIERPGVSAHGDVLRVALHAPTAAYVELVGEWTGWCADPLPLRSTRDGAYWWAELPTSSLLSHLGRTDVHGVRYKLRLNQVLEVPDPAADWVESSHPEAASLLVDHARFVWQSDEWQRPGWEYLVVYQLHPSRFARRNGLRGLDAITRELTGPGGYLERTGATALLLMPTAEFAGEHGWGYNPSFFYAVESSYGGPEALKRLVDACHLRGVAVLLDMVYNHAGTSDNPLWSVARDSFFDGDTEWGAMVNFDHPQVCHFFEQNLLFFMRSYRIDGFRFDFTRVIRYGGTWSSFVRQPGSGGGWEFLHRLRAAVHRLDPRCLLMAEHLPNEWDLTNFGGPMDTQWADDFHDRLVEAARGWPVLSQLAEAMQLTHTACDNWYGTTNYPESHDEVGNEPNRIAHVAGVGQGYRRSKVVAATTLLSRGIPLWFMGAESGEWRPFSKDGDEPLDLDAYEADESARCLRAWWYDLCALRRGNEKLQGPAPLAIHFVDESLLAFSRGAGAELFVVLSFGPSPGARSLAALNLPESHYKELLNSTWGSYRIAAEHEPERGNGGWSARLGREHWLDVPDYGVVVLERL